jgi:hypothetical protein
MLCDQEIPDNHPLLTRLLQILLQEQPIMVLPPVITMQERVDLGLVTAYRMFASCVLIHSKRLIIIY